MSVPSLTRVTSHTSSDSGVENNNQIAIEGAFATIDDSNVAAASLSLTRLKQSGAAVGNVPVWNGTAFVPLGAYAMAPTILAGPPAVTTTILTANMAYLVPIFGVVAPTTISRIWCPTSSGSGTGNIDVGIYYSDDEATFTRLVSKGSTATPGNSLITIASTVITPVSGRRWFWGFGCSSAAPTFAATGSPNTPWVFTKATSFPLPATLTGMTGPGAVASPAIFGMV